MKTDTGLAVDATDAFVDRAPIDWRALRARAREPDDRALVDALQLLDRLRSSDRPARARRPASIPQRAVCAIGAAAVIQTAIALILAVPAIANGGSPRAASQVLLAATFGAAALLLVSGASRDPRRLFLLGMLLCSASAFARGALTLLSLAPATARLWLEVFAPACMWQFALDFPRVHRFTMFDAVARRMSALMWAFGLAAFVLNLGVIGGAIPDALVGALLPTHRSNLFWRAYTIAMLLAVAVIFVRSRRAPRSERRKVGRFAAALTFGAAPFLALGLARTIVPAIDRWLVSATPAARVWIDAIVIGALLATPVLMSVAVAVDRPFELQGIARRMWARLARRVAYWPDRRQRRQLSKVFRRLRTARGNREIGVIAADAIAAGIGATVIRVLVPDGRNGWRDTLGASACLPADAALVAMLQRSASALDLTAGGPLRNLLPPVERDWLEAHGVQLAAAIAPRDRTVAAIVVAGRERGALSLTGHDLWFVEALTAATSSAWTGSPDDGTEHSGDSQSPAELGFECATCGVVQPSSTPACDCGTAPVIAALPPRLREFVVRRRLGAGGMGVVYLARDVRLDRDVALKTLPAVRPEAAALLSREARAMATLNHDALATIYGLEIWRDVPVLVFEYFPLGTLAQRLSAGGPLTPETAVHAGVALARALDCMHGHGLLHGDVKPANVGFTARNDVKLLDFGLSRMAARDPYDLPAAHAGGTLAYLSPEALGGQAPSVSFDLWALAVLLLESVTGRNPFVRATPAATRWEILTADIIEVCRPVESCSPELAALLRRALGPPAVRFATARAMHTALAALRARRNRDQRE